MEGVMIAKAWKAPVFRSKRVRMGERLCNGTPCFRFVAILYIDLINTNREYEEAEAQNHGDKKDGYINSYFELRRNAGASCQKRKQKLSTIQSYPLLSTSKGKK
jgi:hypothetical protein